MSFQDIVSDFVARINNGLQAGHKTVEVVKSKFIVNLCKKLVKLNLIDSFEEQDRFVTVQINSIKLAKLKRVSKPSQRVFLGFEDRLPLVDGFGYTLITTSTGILTDVESRTNKVGGEAVLQAIKPYLTRKN
jgi:small subunit ribosomal protein S8